MSICPIHAEPRQGTVGSILIPGYQKGIGGCLYSRRWLKEYLQEIFKYHVDANADNDLVVGNWFVDYIPENDPINCPQNPEEGDRSGRVDHLLCTASIVASDVEVSIIEQGGAPIYHYPNPLSIHFFRRNESYRDRIQYRLGALFANKYIMGEIDTHNIKEWIIYYTSGRRRFDPFKY